MARRSTAPRLCRDVRPDRRRPRPPRRHRASSIEVEHDYTLRAGGYGEEVKFGGGKMIRDGMGQSQRVSARGRRHGHHQRARSSTTGASSRPTSAIKDGRIAGHRQGRQPRRPAGRRHRHRRRHRDHRRRGHDRHRRRHRLAHPLHLPAADRGSADERRHHDARRRHRPGDRHLRHHLHAGPVAHPRDAAGGRGLPDEPRLPGQGQRQPARAARGAGRGRRLRPEAARGLGHDAGGDRQLPRASPTSTTSRSTIHTDTLNESGFVEDTIAAFKGRTIHTFHTEGAGGGHAPDIIKVRGPAERAAVVDQPDACPTPSTRSTSTSTC